MKNTGLKTGRIVLNTIHHVRSAWNLDPIREEESVYGDSKKNFSEFIHGSKEKVKMVSSNLFERRSTSSQSSSNRTSPTVQVGKIKNFTIELSPVFSNRKSHSEQFFPVKQRSVDNLTQVIYSMKHGRSIRHGVETFSDSFCMTPFREAGYGKGQYMVKYQKEPDSYLFKNLLEGRAVMLQDVKDGIPCHLEVSNAVIVSGLMPQLNYKGRVAREARFQDNNASHVEQDRFSEQVGLLQVFIPNALRFGTIKGQAFEKETHLLMENLIESKKQIKRICDQNLQNEIRQFDKQSVELMIIADFRFWNTDRNQDNILVAQDKKVYGIDHALILPEKFLSGMQCAWQDWPQAHEPFSQSAKEFIAQLDFQKDKKDILEVYPLYPASNLKTMELSYFFLKKAAELDLTPAQLLRLTSASKTRDHVFSTFGSIEPDNEIGSYYAELEDEANQVELLDKSDFIENELKNYVVKMLKSIKKNN